MEEWICDDRWRTDPVPFIAFVRTLGDIRDDVADDTLFLPIIAEQPIFAALFQFRPTAVLRAFRTSPHHGALAYLVPHLPPRVADEIYVYLHKLCAAQEWSHIISFINVFHDVTEDRGAFWWAGAAVEDDPWSIAESYEHVSIAFVHSARDPRDVSAAPVADLAPDLCAFIASACGARAVAALAAMQRLTMFVTSSITHGFEHMHLYTRTQRIILCHQHWMQPPRETFVDDARRIQLALQLLAPTRQEMIEIEEATIADIADCGQYIFGMRRILTKDALDRLDLTHLDQVVLFVSNATPDHAAQRILRTTPAQWAADPSARILCILLHHALRASADEKTIAEQQVVEHLVSSFGGGHACEHIVHVALCCGKQVFTDIALTAIRIAMMDERFDVLSLYMSGDSDKQNLFRRFVSEQRVPMQCAMAVLMMTHIHRHDALAAHIVQTAHAKCSKNITRHDVDDVVAFCARENNEMACAIMDAMTTDVIRLAREPALQQLWMRDWCTPLFRLRVLELYPTNRAPPMMHWIMDSCTGHDRILLRTILCACDHHGLATFASRKPELFTGPVQREWYIMIYKERQPHPLHDRIETTILSHQGENPAMSALQQMLQRSRHASLFRKAVPFAPWRLFAVDPALLLLTAVVPLIREHVLFDRGDAIDPSFDPNDWKQELSALAFDL